MGNEWQQIGGDMTASAYGATFGQLDENYDGTADVNVVEILYMPEHTEYTGEHPYYVETSWCPVDDIDNVARIRSIMDCMGLLRYENDDTPEYPERVRERVTQLETSITEYRKLYNWQGAWRGSQERDFITAQDELETLRRWFSIPRMMRAEAMHSYGGYTSDTYSTREYKTLARAMQSQGIPRSALWRESEYDAVPDDIEAGDNTRLSITIPFNHSIAHWNGVDSDGNVWYEYDMRGYLDVYADGEATCKGCGERIGSHCWHDEYDMDVYCPDCVDYTFGHIALPE